MNTHTAIRPTIPALGDPSPWGTIDCVSSYGADKHPMADQITFASTPSHGGFYLGPEALAMIPEAWRARRHAYARDLNSPWFDEDIDWSMVALWFPGLFNDEDRQRAAAIFVAYRSNGGAS